MKTLNQAQIKQEFLLNPDIVFLNHGSFGATPRPVFESYQRWQLVLEHQPVEFIGRKAPSLLQHARAVLAEYLHTQPDNLVYVTNATTGLNIIARSLALKPGDEVLSTDHEYGAMDRTWKFAAHQHGFKYINYPIPIPLTSDDEFVQSLWEGVTPDTRVIFISHITSPTALIFPIKEICARARENGILTVIDGAHVPGQIPLDLDKLGADFYSGNLHKWLCAPKGSAFIYARPEVQHLIEPLIISWGWESDHPGPSKFVDHLEYTGTRDIAAFLAVEDAIRFQQNFNWDNVRINCHSLLTETLLKIQGLTNLPALWTNSDHWYSQMASAILPPSVNVDDLKIKLYDDFKIEVPVLEWNHTPLIRISIQGYNGKGDVDQLLEALKQLL